MIIKRHLSNLPENLFHQLRRPPELPRLPPAEERFPLLGQEGASKEENKYHFQFPLEESCECENHLFLLNFSSWPFLPGANRRLGGSASG